MVLPIFVVGNLDFNEIFHIFVIIITPDGIFILEITTLNDILK